MEAAIVTGVFTLGGVIAVLLIEGRRAESRRKAEHEGQAQARVRDWRMKELGETREVLIANLSWLEQRVVLRQEPSPLNLADRTRSNINLVGDPEVVSEYVTLLQDLSAKLPLTVGEALRERVRPPRITDLDPDLLERTTRMRARLCQALDEQELRVLRDEPLRELSLGELSMTRGADALLDDLRARQRGGGHEPPPAR